MVNAGYRQVILQGEGEIVDICQLTCLELHLDAVTQPAHDPQPATGHGNETTRTDMVLPILQVEGIKLCLIWPASQKSRSQKSETTTQMEEKL